MTIKLRKHNGMWLTRTEQGPTWKHSDLDTAIAFLKSQGAPT